MHLQSLATGPNDTPNGASLSPAANATRGDESRALASTAASAASSSANTFQQQKAVPSVHLLSYAAGDVAACYGAARQPTVWSVDLGRLFAPVSTATLSWEITGSLPKTQQGFGYKNLSAQPARSDARFQAPVKMSPATTKHAICRMHSVPPSAGAFAVSTGPTVPRDKQ